MLVSIDKTYMLDFFKDKRGYGDLVLFEGKKTMAVTYSRSGSIDHDGTLKNSINHHKWYLCGGPEAPFGEEEANKMWVKGKPGKPWKQRLWPIPVPGDHDPVSRILIHPDGGLPGTGGCVGPQDTNAMDFYYFFKWYFLKKNHGIISLSVRV